MVNGIEKVPVLKICNLDSVGGGGVLSTNINSVWNSKSVDKDATSDGKLNSDGSGTRVAANKDKNGNLIQIIEKLGPGGKVLQKQTQTIDKTGKMVSVVDIKNSYDKDGNLKEAKQTAISIENGKKLKSTVIKQYEYDENGKLKQTVSKGKDKTGKPNASVTEYENGEKVRKHSKSYQKGSLTETITDFRQSAAGLPQATVIYGKDGKTVQEKIENTFDEEGILNGQKRTDEKGNTVTYDYSKLDGNFDIGNQQSRGNCYFLASVNALRETPEGHDMLKRTVKDNGDGTYTITFPGAKLGKEGLINGDGGKQITLLDGTKVDKLPEDKVYIQDSYTVTEEELKAALKQQGKRYSVGDRDVVLLEVAFEKYRKSVNDTMLKNGVDPGKNHFIAGVEVPSKRLGTDDVLSSGKGADALFVLTGHQASDKYSKSGTPTCYINSDMHMEVANGGFLASVNENVKAMGTVAPDGFTNNIDKLITKLQRDYADGKLDEYAATAGFNVSQQEVNGEVIVGGGHELTITRIDNKNVYMRNPWDPAKEISMSLKDFKKSAKDLTLVPLKEANAAQQTTLSQQTPQQAPLQPVQTPAQPVQPSQGGDSGQDSVVSSAQNNKPNYHVKKGEGYTAIIKKALQDQGIEPTKENIQKAKAQFEQANPGAVHVYNGRRQEWRGNKFLCADADVFIPQFKM